MVFEDPTTVWSPITVASWYGSGERTVKIVSDTTVWHSTGSVKQTAWYYKSHPTFSDAVALVRRRLWVQEPTFCRLAHSDRDGKSPAGVHGTLPEAVC